ncbi:protein NRT1/ PTR FAMILY 2.8-like [Prosopis cineraria]|uniref:protein NRT1/ PTR FAMILY 2.8-like n=1 Tax=Prosopis cineraria TaxID=364024 RepID=UPI00240ED2F1|nr:protein NRT1/ PTR FAMILY 2.8-like [Prosopis cineraria]
MSESSSDSSAHLPPPSSSNQHGGWRAVKYILGNETFEKLAAMSLIANLVVYLHTQYNLDNTYSAEVFSIWSGFSNFLPLLGAYVADAYLGKYHMLFFGLIASFLGMALVSLGAGLPSLRPPACNVPTDCIQPTGPQLAVLYIGLGLMAAGSGGLRPCNIAFGADQFDVSTEKGRAQLESFCNWWYFLFTVALLLALTLVVYIQTNVSWLLGFAIPTACFAISTVLFLLGRNTYIRMKPKGSVIVDLVKVIVASSRKRHVNIGTYSELSFYDPPPTDPKITVVRTDRFTCLDKASVILDANELNDEGKPRDGWRLCSVKQVEELKAILRTIPVWVAGIFCFLSMTQTGSFGILQAIQMHKSVGNHRFNVPPAWLGLVPMISLSIWIYIYEKIFIPWAQKAFAGGRRLSIEHRILIGIVFSIICMIVSGTVEVERRESALKRGSFESPMSMWMLVPQFTLSGLTEAFAAIAMMELLTSYWPENMKAIGGAVFFLSLSIANYLTTILIEVIKATTSLKGRKPWLGGNDLNKNRLEYYYYTIAVIGALNLFYFLLFARHFLCSKVLPIRHSVDEQLDSEERGTR